MPSRRRDQLFFRQSNAVKNKERGDGYWKWFQTRDADKQQQQSWTIQRQYPLIFLQGV